MPKKRKQVIISEDDLDLACHIFRVAHRSKDVADVAGKIAAIISAHRREHWSKGWDAAMTDT